jgi:hypothetical protein
MIETAGTDWASGFEFLWIGFGLRLAARWSIFFCVVLCAFLLGVLRKTGVLTWCFGGEVVVFCVVDVVF